MGHPAIRKRGFRSTSAARCSRRADSGSILALLTLALLTGSCTHSEPETGAVVESCQVGLGASLAGLESGDVLRAWAPAERPEELSPLRGPFHLAGLEADWGAAGGVLLEVRRGRQRLRIHLADSVWGLQTRPVLPGRSRGRYLAARQAFESGASDEAATLFESLAEELREERSLTACWMRLQAAAARLREEVLHGGEEPFDGALPCSGIDDPGLLADVLTSFAETLDDANARPAAEKAWRRALELRRRIAGPDSLPVAVISNRLAQNYSRMQRFDGEPLSHHALAILEAKAPGSLETLFAYLHLGSLAYARRDLDAAESFWERGLLLGRRQPRASLLPAQLLSNLGLVSYKRGDLEAAEEQFRRFAAWTRQYDPEGRSAGFAANYLGLVAKARGDFELARTHFRHALEVFRALGAEREFAGSLNNLANVTDTLGDLPGAIELHRQALVVRRRMVPGTLDLAASLTNLGKRLRLHGDLEEAERLQLQALEIKERLAPDSLLHATTLHELGELALDSGDLEAASAYQLRSLELRQRVVPDSEVVAENLYALGAIAQRRGDLAEAERLWRRAIEIIDRQGHRLRFTADDRARFDARHYNHEHQLAKLLCQQGRAREAFELLERSRARALRLLFAQRDVMPAELPVELRSAGRRVESDLERATGRLERLGPAARAERIESIRARFQSLEAQRARLDEEVRRRSPRYAAFADPEPLDLEAVAEALDPGALLLSYAVMSDRTLLFVVSGGATPSLVLHVLEVGEEELERRVSIFRALVARGLETDTVEPALALQGERLYRLLLGPAEQALLDAERLVIAVEGPLLGLPFAALVSSHEPLTYLGVTKPLSFVPSGSVLAELASERRAGGSSGGWIGFGAPEIRADLGFRPLPYSREELLALERLMPQGRAHLGADATESAVRRLSGGARYLHFATHALLDRRSPLESALALTPDTALQDRRGDGLLEAWEVILDLRLEADLVTLSGCETGLGTEVEGEGLLGLARAFHYAGARSLLVSIWEVSDRSTAELMTAFYRHLLGGLPKDEALRRSRRDLALQATGPDHPARSHPFHWAAFRLLGDYR